MRKLLTEFIDILFPPSQEEKLLRDTNLNTLRALYRPGTFKKIEYLLSYSEPLIQTAVIENKFYHNQLAATLLGRAIEIWAADQIQPTIYIPIPLGKRRLQQRGHNQVETILKSTQMKLQINNKIMRRVIETVPQSHLDKEARQKNVQNVFIFAGKTLDFFPGTQLVLVDDVVTTGTTMLEARAVLVPHLPPGVTLRCLALAH